MGAVRLVLGRVSIGRVSIGRHAAAVVAAGVGAAACLTVAGCGSGGAAAAPSTPSAAGSPSGGAATTGPPSAYGPAAPSSSAAPSASAPPRAGAAGDAACHDALHALQTLQANQIKDQKSPDALARDFTAFAGQLKVDAKKETSQVVSSAMTTLAGDYTGLVASRANGTTPDITAVQTDGQSFDQACGVA